MTNTIKNRNPILSATIKTVITLIIIVCAFALNVMLQTNIDNQERNNIEQENVNKLDHSIVLNTTAELISKDGNLPIEVAKKYAHWIYEASIKYSIDPILIMAVIATESNFNYKAISPTGPIGLMQIAASYHKDKTTRVALFDPRNNIMVGAQILKEYSKRTSNTINTLLMYNGSFGKAPIYATKVLKKKMYYDKKIMEAISI